MNVDTALSTFGLVACSLLLGSSLALSITTIEREPEASRKLPLGLVIPSAFFALCCALRLIGTPAFEPHWLQYLLLGGAPLIIGFASIWLLVRFGGRPR